MQVISKKTTPSSESTLEAFTLDVGGMKCAGCVRAAENQLTQQPGVISATVNLVTEMALVECEPGVVDPLTLAEKLTEIGFPSQPRYPQGDTLFASERSTVTSPAERHRQETRSQIWQATIATLLLILSTIGHLDHVGITIPGLTNIWLHWGLATLALLFPGRSILTNGWQGLRHNAPNMNTLVGLGTLTAYAASIVALLFPTLGWECFFDEPVMLVGFILLGRTLEQHARSKATAALQSLAALQPATARLIKGEGGRMKDENENENGNGHRGLHNTSSPSASDPSNTNQPLHPSSFILHPSIEIPADRVKVGEWLQVLPGDKIPVDGEILAGQTTINESMLTGEAVPALKRPGDTVTAGSLNLSGAITLRATRTGKDTTLAQIIALVETAQTRKAPIQGLADTVAGYFTYGVMTIALLTFLFWYFIGTPLWSDHLLAAPSSMLIGHPMMLHPSSSLHPSSFIPHPSPLLLSLKLAIAVLVIACPCALGLATPTAILVGSGIGAERGLLIRGGDVLEKVHQLHTIVFDKTGTLTVGCPTLTDCVALSNISPSTLLQIAATVESGTQHPLAESIRREATQQSLSLLPAQEFHTELGLGVSALVEEQPVILGSQDWLYQHGIEIDDTAQQQVHTLITVGKTVVYIGVAGKLAGLIAVQDTLRPDARATIDRLRQMGLRVIMLTGAQPTAAEAIAHSLGFAKNDIVANVRPTQKAQIIQSLQSSSTESHSSSPYPLTAPSPHLKSNAKSNIIAMVGDGINDAPALAQADIGIALHSGTDVAIETAGIILMRDRLSDVVEAIRLSRATFNKIRQNLFWALFYNLLGIPIAAGILLPTFGIIFSPATAGALMAFSSVSVVTNSLFLRRAFSEQRIGNRVG